MNTELVQNPTPFLPLSDLDTDYETPAPNPPVLVTRKRTVKRVAAPKQSKTKKPQYTIHPDNSITGEDGFDVPRSFEAFITQFPHHVHHWTRRHMPYSSEADVEDRTQELLIHLMTLPPMSKFREPGYNGFPDGCQDRIQTFTPGRSYGASLPRFLNFINIALVRCFITLSKKALQNPVRRPGNVAYQPGAALWEEGMVDEEYIHQHQVENFKQRVATKRRSLDLPVMMREFREFLEEHGPELIPSFEALLECDNYAKAQQRVGMNRQQFTRCRARIEALVECFHHSVVPSPAPPPPARRRSPARVKSKPCPVMTPVAVAVSPAPVHPTHQDIATMAYLIWQERGCPDGKDREHWIEAEWRLRS